MRLGVVLRAFAVLSTSTFVLTGSQQDESLPVRISEVRQLGCADCDGPQQFGRIQGLSVDSDGGVYVADLYPPFIRVWSSDGLLRAFVGQEGAGPGEFHRVADIYPSVGGGFSAVDRRLRRWTFYGPNGELERTTTLGGAITETAFSKRENALYAAVRTRSGTAGCRATAIQRWKVGDDGSSTIVAEIADAPPGKYSGCPAAVYNLDTIPKGGFGLGFGFDDYLLVVFDASGSPRHRVVLDVPRVPRTPDEMEVERRRVSIASAEPDPLRDHFMGSSLRYDSAGRAWVRTERGVGDETIFDIFSTEGVYLGVVALPIRVKSPGHGFDLAGDYLVTIHTDESSFTELVRVWRVEWLER